MFALDVYYVETNKLTNLLISDRAQQTTAWFQWPAEISSIFIRKSILRNVVTDSQIDTRKCTKAVVTYIVRAAK